MLSAVDTAMGMLLGVSAFLLILTIVGYMRSGVRSLLLLSEGLSIHIVFTAMLICFAFFTDWLDRVDGMLMIIVDAIVLLAVILLGHFGGRPGGRPS